MRSLTVCWLLLLAPAFLQAEPITYTITGIANGDYLTVVDSQPESTGSFSNTPFVIQLKTDTSMVDNYPGNPTVGLTNQIPSGWDQNSYIAVGKLSGNLQYGYGLSVYQNLDQLRLFEYGFDGNPVMDLNSPAFGSYNLLTDAGIVSDSTIVDYQEGNGQDVRLASLFQFTQNGGVMFTSVDDVSFIARTDDLPTAPEPATWALSAIPLLGLMGMKRLRRDRDR